MIVLLRGRGTCDGLQVRWTAWISRTRGPAAG